MKQPIGQRHSSKRDAIITVIRESRGPLTANEIMHEVQSKYFKVGIATVYRNVKLLLENGQIKDVILPDGETRYEAADLHHHPHFHCRSCGRVYDLPECLVKLPEDNVLPGGFRVEDHELTLHGLCEDCA